MDKSWWKPFGSSKSALPPKASTLHSEKNNGEQIFYVNGDDGASVMTGISQQELLRKKARSESKKRTNNKLFGKRKKKKNPIVSLPPALLGGNKKHTASEKGKFYSSSSMPSSVASPKRLTVKRNRPANLDTSSQSSSGLWKAQWGGDEKESDTTAESTFTDSVPAVQKTPSMETPYSAVPQPWAVVNENEGDSFLSGKEPHETSGDHCSIDEYSFPLLSTGALGGITEDAVAEHREISTKAFNSSNMGVVPMEAIPEIYERSSTISASRSDTSSRVRFSSTAELSTIVGVDADGMPLVEVDETGAPELYTSTYLSYMIDLDSPSPVARILDQSSTHTPTPTKRQRKSRSELSPVRSILRPARYGDRNGRVIGGRKKAYVRAMSFLRASQILRQGRSTYEEDDVAFAPEPEPQFGSLSWVPAVSEEESEQLHFVDPNGAELSPIRENKYSNISESHSKSEDWSEFEESETMQRLSFIEAVAAVVIQTGYRRHRATKFVNALRREAEISKYERMYAEEQQRLALAQNSLRIDETQALDESQVLHTRESHDIDAYSRYFETQRSPKSSPQGKNSENTQADSPRAESPRETMYFDSEKPRLVRDQALLDMDESLEENMVEPAEYFEPKQLQKEFGVSPRKEVRSGHFAQPTSQSAEAAAKHLPETFLNYEEDEEKRLYTIPMIYGERRKDDGSFPTLPAAYDMSRKWSEGSRAQTSSKASVADSASMSEITMEKDIHSIEEPKQKTVSGYVNDIEGSDGPSKPVLEQVVHLHGQSVRILASSGFKETSQPVPKSPTSQKMRQSKKIGEKYESVPKPSAQVGAASRVTEKSKVTPAKGDNGAARQHALPPPQRRYGKRVDPSLEGSQDSEKAVEAPVNSIKFVEAAVKIQSVFRGFWARDCLNVDHYCAMIIQKTFRGFQCRVNYQYDRYRIIVVQSVWRRSIARSDVAHILACTILIQSLIRGYLARLKRRDSGVSRAVDESESDAALTIQCSWRRFTAETYLIRQLVDVLICQSVARGWLARQELKRLKSSKEDCPGQSYTSSDSSISETPPLATARETKKRSALGPPNSPDAGVAMQTVEDELGPGKIPAVRRLSSPRDGRPPIAPVRSKSSKLVEKYENGLRQAEKDRREAQVKTNSDGQSYEKVEIVAPVENIAEHLAECISSADDSKEGDASVNLSTETDILGEDSASTNAEITPSGFRKKNAENARSFVDDLPDDNQYKEYYRIWAARGLLQPRTDGKTGTGPLAEPENEESSNDVGDIESEKLADTKTLPGLNEVSVEAMPKKAVSTPVTECVPKDNEEAEQQISGSSEDEIQSDVHDAAPDEIEKNDQLAPSATNTVTPSEESETCQSEGLQEASQPKSTQNSSTVLPEPTDTVKKVVVCTPIHDEAENWLENTRPSAGVALDNISETAKKPADETPRVGSVSTIVSQMSHPKRYSKLGTSATTERVKRRIKRLPTDDQPERANPVSLAIISDDEPNEQPTPANIASIEAPKRSDETSNRVQESAPDVRESMIEEKEVERQSEKSRFQDFFLSTKKPPVNQSFVISSSGGKVSHQDEKKESETLCATSSKVLASKSVVAYPEGFEMKNSRRRAVDKSLKSTSSKEKKDADSLNDIQKEGDTLVAMETPVENCQEPPSVKVVEAPVPAVLPLTTGMDEVDTETEEKAIAQDDPFFSAYTLWHAKGLLPWKPALSGDH